MVHGTSHTIPARQFNELQYSENLISCLTVSTAEALRENVPLIECYRRTLDKWYADHQQLCPTPLHEHRKYGSPASNVHNAHKRGTDSRDPAGESLQLRLESFEVVKGEPIDVNWYTPLCFPWPLTALLTTCTTSRQHKHQDNRVNKRDLHIRIYRHQDWGKMNGRHTLEWELLRETYLHQTPLGG